MRYLAINPYFVPIVPVLVMLVAFFYPSDAWQAIFDEPNKSFLNFTMFLFVLGCLFFLYLGIYLTQKISIPERNAFVAETPENSLPVLILAPVLLGTLLVLSAFILYLVQYHPGYMFLTFTGQGSLAKEMIQRDEVDFSSVPNFAIPVIWWGWYRYFQANAIGDQSAFVRWLLIVTTTILFFVLTVIAARFALMPLVIGLFIIYTKFRVFDVIPVHKHWVKSINLYIWLISGIVLIFALISLARGYDGVDRLFEMILGYGPVSFNRLAYVLDGKLTFEYASTGYYIIPEPIFSFIRVLFAESALSSFDVWHSEFDGIAQAGINEQFIWLTQFGYAYSTIGILTIFLFFFYGVMLGTAWSSFLSGNLYGLVFYPLIYFSVFFLFGYFHIVQFFPYYVFMFLILYFWEFVVRLVLMASIRYQHGE